MNWNEIKTAYITGQENLREIAERFGIVTSTVRSRSRREKWNQARMDYQRELLKKAMAEVSEQQQKPLENLLMAAERAAEVAAEALSDEKVFFRYVVKETDAEKQSVVTEKLFNKPDTAAMKNMTAVLKELTTLLRDFYDVPTPSQKHTRKISEEKLEIERARSAATEHSDSELGVIVLPAVRHDEE